MSTTPVQYVVTATPNIASSEAGNNNTPSVFNIYYVDKNGADQKVIGFNAPLSTWSISFTGTVGSIYSISAIEISNHFPVTVSIYKAGSLSTSTDNSTDTTINAGVTGTI
jgi:hypothetical protein